ncbi:MAG: DUF2442 domain-containing protein [Candidatus Hydrogenedentes bacterium]|nr:DUF2442 domain-containing protein [Candidatus Hydrogenedentota bacterium]
MRKITDVKVLPNFRLGLTFDSGESGEVDLSRLVGCGVFAQWNDEDRFRQVEIGPAGELQWDDSLDLCPDALYLEATGKEPEELFANLNRENAHA